MRTPPQTCRPALPAHAHTPPHLQPQACTCAHTPAHAHTLPKLQPRACTCAHTPAPAQPRACTCAHTPKPAAPCLHMRSYSRTCSPVPAHAHTPQHLRSP
eukprot:1186191-Prorocentrum_minimum.AAC.1